MVLRSADSFPADTETLSGISAETPRERRPARRIPDQQRFSVSPPAVCAVLVYLRTGPDEYRVYNLEGGP